MAGLNVNGYAGSGVGAQAPYPAQPQPQPQYQYQPQFQQPQYQYQYYPYGGYPPQQMQAPYPPASSPVPTPPGSHHQNSGTQSLDGNTKQSGTFKGHGTGASIQGGFTATGSIA